MICEFECVQYTNCEEKWLLVNLQLKGVGGLRPWDGQNRVLRCFH